MRFKPGGNDFQVFGYEVVGLTVSIVKLEWIENVGTCWNQ